GSRDMGAWISVDHGMTFNPWPNAPHLRALAERNGVLYAAGDNALDGFALGVSYDQGATWQGLVTFSRICGVLEWPNAQTGCAIPFQWVQAMFAISASACTPVLPPDGGVRDAAAIDAPGTAAGSGGSGGGGDGGCGCSVGGRTSPGIGVALVLLALVARRRHL